MAFVTFREDKKKARSKFLALIIGAAILFVGWNLLVMDVATTGAFWDALGLKPVIPPTLFHPYNVSTEGWIIAVFLSGFQIYASYKIAQYPPKTKDQRFWIFLRVATAIIDTFTDIDYRSYNFATPSKSISSLLISIVAFNFGSEWAVTGGFALVAENFASAFPFLAELMKVMQEMWKFAMEILSSGKDDKPKDGTKGGGGGDNHKPQDHPAPAFSRSSFRPGGDHQRRNFSAPSSPAPSGGVNPKELAEKKSRGQMGDDDFFDAMKRLPPPLRRTVMAELPPKERERLENKMRQEMGQMNSPFGGANA